MGATNAYARMLWRDIRAAMPSPHARKGVLERRVKWRNASCWANRGTVIRIWGSSLGDLERTGQSGHARAFRTLRGAVWGGQTCQGATRRRMSAVANYALRTHEGESQEQGASGAWLGRGAGLLLNLKRTVRTRLVRQCSTRHRVYSRRGLSLAATCPLVRAHYVGT